MEASFVSSTTSPMENPYSYHDDNLCDGYTIYSEQVEPGEIVDTGYQDQTQMCSQSSIVKRKLKVISTIKVLIN